MYDDFKIYKFIKNDDETLMCGHHRGFSFTWGMERGYSLWHKIKWWCVLYIGKVCRTRKEWRADIHKMPLFSPALPLSFSLFSLYISKVQKSDIGMWVQKSISTISQNLDPTWSNHWWWWQKEYRDTTGCDNNIHVSRQSLSRSTMATVPWGNASSGECPQYYL